MRRIMFTGRKPVTLVNNTPFAYELICNSGHVWRVLWLFALNGDNVARVVDLSKVDSAGNVLHTFTNQSLATTVYVELPHISVQFQDRALAFGYVFPDERIKFSFAAGGASAGGTGYVGFVLEDLTGDDLPVLEAT